MSTCPKKRLAYPCDYNITFVLFVRLTTGHDLISQPRHWEKMRNITVHHTSRDNKPDSILARTCCYIMYNLQSRYHVSCPTEILIRQWDVMGNSCNARSTTFRGIKWRRAASDQRSREVAVWLPARSQSGNASRRIVVTDRRQTFTNSNTLHCRTVGK